MVPEEDLLVSVLTVLFEVSRGAEDLPVVASVVLRAGAVLALVSVEDLLVCVVPVLFLVTSCVDDLVVEVSLVVVVLLVVVPDCLVDGLVVTVPDFWVVVEVRLLVTFVPPWVVAFLVVG